MSRHTGLRVVECPVCGKTQVITNEHHQCTGCGHGFPVKMPEREKISHAALKDGWHSMSEPMPDGCLVFAFTYKGKPEGFRIGSKDTPWFTFKPYAWMLLKLPEVSHEP